MDVERHRTDGCAGRGAGAGRNLYHVEGRECPEERVDGWGSNGGQVGLAGVVGLMGQGGRWSWHQVKMAGLLGSGLFCLGHVT